MKTDKTFNKTFDKTFDKTFNKTFDTKTQDKSIYSKTNSNSNTNTNPNDKTGKKVNNLPAYSGKIKYYLSKENVIQLTKSWHKKIYNFMVSKYKPLFIERNYDTSVLSNDILKELKTVDFEFTNQSSYITMLERKILKKLSKKEIINKVRLGSCDNIRELAPRPKSCSTIVKVKVNDHQKQQLLKSQRTYNKGNF